MSFRNGKILGVVLTLYMVVFVLFGSQAIAGTVYKVKTAQAKYVVLAWNNLGMHCYQPDYSNLAILPPYNTLCAQVIKVNPWPAKPEVVTQGVTVEYKFPENSYSVAGPGVPKGKPDKTNFWKYAKDLFGVELQPNIGLTGKGLAGTFDKALDGNYFIAEGIPLTEYRDQDAVNRKPYPFQLAQVTVKTTGKPTVQLATLTVVAPVSTELSCVNCHADDGDATMAYPITPTGKVETNILAIHDYLNDESYDSLPAALEEKTPLMDNQPVLCAGCHGSNALGTPEVTGVKNLSNAVHGHHNPDVAPDITPDTAGCYNCHPGANTKCLRDTMSQNFSLCCEDCHGDITQVAQNPDPWLKEPKCGKAGCHGSAYDPAEPLYQKSTGHGALYCEGCHDSTHAIAPSSQPNDTIKFIQLQGHAGTLSECKVCHVTKPDTKFNHIP